MGLRKVRNFQAFRVRWGRKCSSTSRVGVEVSTVLPRNQDEPSRNASETLHKGSMCCAACVAHAPCRRS